MLVLFVLYILILYRGNQSNSSLPVEGHKLKNDLTAQGPVKQPGWADSEDRHL